jgi:hypothetical protein
MKDNTHLDYDTATFAFLLSDYPDANDRFSCVTFIVGVDARGRRRSQAIPSTLSMEEIVDIVDDPYGAAYPS